MLYRQCKRKR